MNMLIRGYQTTSVSDFLLESSFQMPEQMPRSAWLGHAPFAFWLMAVLKPRTVVELGVHSGFSYLALCQAVRELRLDCTCSGIDTWVGDEHAGFYENDVYDQLVSDHLRNDAFSQLMRSSFEDARSNFAAGSIDLLHIDGRHHYEDVRTDFESWKPKLSSRAIVLFHDVTVPAFGVSRLWDELSSEYPHFSFDHSHGLGVLGVGYDLPLKMRQLFGLSDIAGAAKPVRDVYELLGASIALRQQLIDAEAMKLSYATSLSWRVTAPLRLVTRVLRRGAASASHIVKSFRHRAETLLPLTGSQRVTAAQPAAQD